MAIYGASLPLILAVSLMIGVLPRAALGAVIYSNGFDSGVPVTKVVPGEPLEPGVDVFSLRALARSHDLPIHHAPPGGIRVVSFIE